MGSDGREHSLQSTDSMEEVRHGETRSGRVSSSTGNIANAAREGMKHSSVSNLCNHTVFGLIHINLKQPFLSQEMGEKFLGKLSHFSGIYRSCVLL